MIMMMLLVVVLMMVVMVVVVMVVVLMMVMLMVVLMVVMVVLMMRNICEKRGKCLLAVTSLCWRAGRRPDNPFLLQLLITRSFLLFIFAAKKLEYILIFVRIRSCHSAFYPKILLLSNANLAFCQIEPNVKKPRLCAGTFFGHR